MAVAPAGLHEAAVEAQRPLVGLAGFDGVARTHQRIAKPVLRVRLLRGGLQRLLHQSGRTAPLLVSDAQHGQVVGGLRQTWLEL